MSTARVIDAVSPSVSYRSVSLVFALSVVVAISEAFLFYGYARYTLWTYLLMLFVVSIAAAFLEAEIPVFQAFALFPAFRLVNLTMPIFVEPTLFWLPLVYGPFIPAIVYVAWRNVGSSAESAPDRSTARTTGIAHELPWWLGGDRSGKLRRLLRRLWDPLAVPADASTARTVGHRVAQALVVSLLPVVAVALLLSLAVLTVYLAEVEHSIITPAPLVPSLDPYSLGLLVVTMIGFVGFVEELLFRGVLQKVLERRLGLVPGLLLASAIFGLLHSGYGVRTEILFAGMVGLVFGIIYDATDSLVLVSVMHGLLNVLVFGVIPLDGGSSIDLLRATLVRELHRVGLWRFVEPIMEMWGLSGVL